ncbi:C39 family peptidase [Dactylosporangium sp. CA-092794]|uniref:C39 family peptidase n=1 Tax=Dactylosporangium sp. CA-092794 TaxID=3239929 RepID=UPI003D8C2BF3
MHRRIIGALLGAGALAAVSVTTATLLGQTTAPAGAHDTGTAALRAEATHPPTATASAPAPDPLDLAPAEQAVSYDFQYQPNFYYCGPASTRIALTSNGISMSQDEVARRLGTTVNGTNSADNATHVLNAALGKDEYQTHWIPGQRADGEQAERLQRDVVAAVTSGRAVVANIVGGATDVGGTYHEFGGGHFVTIVAYRDHGRQVQIADPSGMFGPRTYWMATYPMANWVASRGYSA